MTTEAGTRFGSGSSLPLRGALGSAGPRVEQGERLERLHAYFLDGCPDAVKPALGALLTRARLIRDGCGDREAGDDMSSVFYASGAVVELASALELDEADIRGAAAAVAETCALPLPAARITLFSQAAGSPKLLELPPLLAAETQLNLMVGLDVLSEISLWRRTAGGLECMLSLGGAGEPSRRVRAEAKAVLRGRSRLSLLGGSNLRSIAVHRFGQPYAAVVGRLGSVEPTVADAFLAEAAASLGPVVEREQLLEHSANRERMLVGASERRLMRLGFDLHDGPIQDVLALAADVRLLQQQVYPFVLEEYRDQASGLSLIHI